MKALVLGLFDSGEEENVQNVHTALFAQHDSKLGGQLSEHINS